jgi:microcystin-dependent protein
MAWTSPKTWSYKETLSSVDLNTYVKDNMNYLKTLLPAGVILPYGGSSAPAEFLICDGSAVSRTTYATLFSAIGDSYGIGDGSSTFNLPNLKGKVPVGKNSAETEFDSLGEAGGSKVAATHTHAVSGNTGSTPSNLAGVDGYGEGTEVAQGRSPGHSHTVSITSAAGGDVSILQPYVVTNFIIKY